MSQMSRRQRFLEFLQILLIFVFITIILPFIWLPCFLHRQLVILIAKFNPKYFGKIFSFADAFLDEDFTSPCPKSCIITTMLIEGNLSIDWLRQRFDKTVLQAKIGKFLRYPELQQYPVGFLGHKFWKWDAEFNIENHVNEDAPLFCSNNNNLDLALIHEELLNRPFQPEMSPWELLLIPNGGQSLLVLRLHHTLADAKSILKLLVECLGGKPLKTATPQQIQLGFWEKSVSSILLPFNYIGYLVKLGKCAIKSHFHPWKVNHFSGEESRVVVGLSEKLSLGKMKKIAKGNGVTTSSLILSMITRAIQKRFQGTELKSELGIGYILPKPGHPQTLTNHVYAGMIHLPLLKTGDESNLHECHERFMQMKKSEMFKCTDFSAYQLGTLPNPLRRIVARNYYSAAGVTNVAGEEEGFSLGNGFSCSEMTMSVGTLPGGGGLVFCAFSYTDGIRTAVIANERIMNAEEANKLAQQVGKELDRFDE